MLQLPFRSARIPRTTARRTMAAALAVGTALAVGVAADSASATAATKLTMYGGYGYGTSAHVGSYVASGRTAVSTLCTSASGVARSNHTAATTIPKVGKVGAVTTRLSTHRTDSGPVSLATTRTAGLSLFGMIHASAVTTTARVARTADGIMRTGSTSIIGLTISGHSSPPAHPSVDQRVTIPGVASIVFNHHATSDGLGSYRMTVVGLTVTIPRGNSLHLPAGRIVIGRGAASLHRQTYANPRGYAFGTSVDAAKLAGSGRTAAVYLPCGGTGGKTTRNHLASGHVPNVLRTGADSSTGYSRDTATSTIASTGNTLAKIALFGGALKARAVTVHARSARDDSGAVNRNNAVSVVGLTVNGKHRAGNVPANTKLAVPGLGTLWIHRVITTPTGVIVRGLDLVLGVTKNGLKRGTELIVGAAYAATSAH